MRRSKRERILDRALHWVGLGATLSGLLVLAVLLIDVGLDGLPRLSWEFLTSYPSRRPEQAGILSALVGSLWLLVLTALVAFPLGVGAAIYLEEYAGRTWWSRWVEVNVANLAAVPSIIYGLLGLEIFVRALFPVTNGRSVLSGALTMSLLVLPISSWRPGRRFTRCRPPSEKRRMLSAGPVGRSFGTTSCPWPCRAS